ncbi:TPA: oligosaccharide repeat unit polymerase [Citrobacter freundii]|nr:oligosaccharide repeat unit polymerase [Citrobacter freundii]HBN5387333.1 oligosaccharide repeat unit polymerase [Citrobacter freundii]HBN5498347.1 oligosaccharide repeat unit polymerase [Citrobacter freundii]HBU9123675.1 oligosaccharide repeat unit polymerase [Citrobacter freundii]
MHLTNNYCNFLFRTRLVRRIFLLVYLASNFYAYMVLTDTGLLIGDYQGIFIKHKEQVAYLLMLTILSYYIVCGPVFSYIAKIKVRLSEIKGLNSFAYLLLFFQVLFFVFNISTGSNTAGTDFQTGGVIRLLWLFLPVDYLFYIYYFVGRGTKVSKIYLVNVIVFILSMLSRGWLGWTLVLLYAELCFFFCSQKTIKNKKNFKYFILLCFFLIVAPLVFSLKVQLRADLYSSGIGGVVSTLSNIDYIQSYNNFIASFLSRIQQLSNIVFFYDHKQELYKLVSSEIVSNYVWEGLPQQTVAKLLGLAPGVDMHVFLYSHYISSSAEAVTTLQVGFISWFFLDTLSSVFYPLYVLIIIGLSLFLSKKIGGEKLCALTWIMIFLSIMCGWYNAYLVYLQALITFYFIMGLLTLITQEKTKANHNG